MSINSVEEKVKIIFDKEKSQSVDLKKIITFIDAAIVQSAATSDQDRSGFLVRRMLNIKDFLSSEVFIKNFVSDFEEGVINTIQEETSKYEWIKKKEELEEEPQQQESILEKDPKTS